MPSLEVVIGLLLIILFYSLLATVIMELLSSILSLRGKHLIKVLKSILASDSKIEEGDVFKRFQANVMYQQLAGKFFGKNTPPSYMESKTFRSILVKIIEQTTEGQTTIEKVKNLSDKNLSKMLEHLWEEADEKVEVFLLKVEQWYDEIMERASGWYKRRVRYFLMLIGLIIAIVFNVDTLSVYHNLVNSTSVELDKLTALASSISDQEIFSEPSDTANQVTEFDTAYSVERELYGLIKEGLRDLKSPLGIGWENADISAGAFPWISKVFGWIIMAICISKGAPFWFDLLKKVVNFRETGDIPIKQTIPFSAVELATIESQKDVSKTAVSTDSAQGENADTSIVG